MAFRDSRCIDASKSNFNDVGHDQITIINQTTNIILPNLALEHVQHLLSNPDHGNPSLSFSPAAGTLSQRSVLSHTSLPGIQQALRDLYRVSGNEQPMLLSPATISQQAAKCHAEISSANDIAAYLIIKIIELLISSDSWDHYRELKGELGSLKQTLTLIGLAIQTYGCTPLGRNLANVVNQQVEECSMVLQEFLSTIKSYRRGLSSTGIGSLWGQVLWSGGEVDKLAPLRIKLSGHQYLLGQCLKALDL